LGNEMADLLELLGEVSSLPYYYCHLNKSSVTVG